MVDIQLIPVYDKNEINLIYFINMILLVLFQDCSFNKLQSDTAIKVSFQGVMRVYGSSSKCSRWFFKFITQTSAIMILAIMKKLNPMVVNY